MRRCGCRRCSKTYIPCQVPSPNRPPSTGTERLVWVSAARTWDGMSSGPSAVWRNSELPSGTSLRQEAVEIAPDIGIGIFLDKQRGRGMADEDGQKAVFHGLPAKPDLDLARDLHQPAAAGLDDKLMAGLA